MISRQLRAFSAILSPTINSGDEFRYANKKWHILQILNDGSVLCQDEDSVLEKFPYENMSALRTIYMLVDPNSDAVRSKFILGLKSSTLKGSVIKDRRIGADYINSNYEYAADRLLIGDVVSLNRENELAWRPVEDLFDLYDENIGDVVIPKWSLLRRSDSGSVTLHFDDDKVAPVDPNVFFTPEDLFVIVDKFDRVSSYNGGDVTYPVLTAMCLTKEYFLEIFFFSGFITSIDEVTKYDFKWKIRA